MSTTGATTKADGVQHEEGGGGDFGRDRLFTQPHPSRAAGISDAIVIKNEDLFFLSESDGTLPCGSEHGLGLYYHDCRYLSGYELRICDERPEALAASGAEGFRSVFRLTNPNIESKAHCLSRQKIVIGLQHVLDPGKLALRDEITIQNCDVERHVVTLSIALDADFRDVFSIRGMSDCRPGTFHAPRWKKQQLVFAYDGADGVRRELRISTAQPPEWRRAGRMRYRYELAPHETKRIGLAFCVVEGADSGHESQLSSEDALEEVEHSRKTHFSTEEWMKGYAEISSDSPCLDRVVGRALRDLRCLRTSLDGRSFFAAGIPWFTTLFGRDSIVSALQMLAYRRDMAADTLRLLASYQGRREDPWCEEEPGRILHELRVGELARMGEIPYSPYYGTVDATALFVILLGQYTRWAGSLGLFEELSAALDGALGWLDSRRTRSASGYVDYSVENHGRIINEGWKDSGNGIVDASGHVPDAPIALVEVQAYAYLAMREAAKLYEWAGDRAKAVRLRDDADSLRARFNRDFWLADKRFLALALCGKDATPLDVVSSNPGHALWCGVVDREREPAIVARLLSDDMYSGWGIRTLSKSEGAYNPIGYHLGTVWPHDNSLIAVGLQRRGFTSEACRVFEGLLDAAALFPDHRLPETFAGCDREELPIPVRYPIACKPQAWACGAIPYLLQALLGLEPDGMARRLHIVRPCLPGSLSQLRMRRIRVADATVDLAFERESSGRVSVRVDACEGDLEVVCEPH